MVKNMSIRLGLPGNRYLPHTQTFLRRVNSLPVIGLNRKASFKLGSCSFDVSITKARDTIALVSQAAIEAAIVPDEWLLEHLASAPNSVRILGSVPWLTVRLSLFGVPETVWPPTLAQSMVTPFPNLLRAYLKDFGIPVKQLINVSGSTEGLVPAVADLGFDTVETGATLSAHSLVEVHTTHQDLALSLVCRPTKESTWTECVGELLRQANEARILKPS